uniref:Uncharacterized protein n=1 Tax=Knipowitschia caucasica TaxID=637954 RepID=A0AAV2IY52_KNICA
MLFTHLQSILISSLVSHNQRRDALEGGHSGVTGIAAKEHVVFVEEKVFASECPAQKGKVLGPEMLCLGSRYLRLDLSELGASEMREERPAVSHT